MIFSAFIDVPKLIGNIDIILEPNLDNSLSDIKSRNDMSNARLKRC